MNKETLATKLDHLALSYRRQANRKYLHTQTELLFGAVPVDLAKLRDHVADQFWFSLSRCFRVVRDHDVASAERMLRADTMGAARAMCDYQTPTYTDRLKVMAFVYGTTADMLMMEVEDDA